MSNTGSVESVCSNSPKDQFPCPQNGRESTEIEEESPYTNNYNTIINELKIKLEQDRPTDIYSYCAQYFKEIAQSTSRLDENRYSKYSNLRKRSSFRGESFNPSMAKHFSFTKHPKSAQVEQKIRDAFKKILVLAHMSENSKKEMIHAFEKREVNCSEVIINQGEKGDYFYVIESGSYQIYNNENEQTKELCKLENNGFFGELALIFDKERNASVKCCSENGGTLWRIAQKTFKHIVCSDSYANRASKISFLRNMSLLIKFTDKQIDSLSDALTEVRFGVGDVIIKEGDKPDALYIIKTGKVKFEKSLLGGDSKRKVSSESNQSGNSNSSLTLGETGPGDYFGEMALIRKDVRAATVTAAANDTRLYQLRAADFSRLMGPCSDRLMMRIKSYGEQENQN